MITSSEFETVVFAQSSFKTNKNTEKASKIAQI